MLLFPNFSKVYGKETRDFDIPTYIIVPKATPEEIVQILKNAAEKMANDLEFIKENRKIFMRLHYVDGDVVTKSLLPDEIADSKPSPKKCGW
jgi:tripartite-type tricarboxylate transporter receptor subunit TctC